MNPFLACEIAVSISLQICILMAIVWLFEQLTQDIEFRGQIWNYGFVAAILILCAGIALPHWRIVQPWTSLPDTYLVSIARWELWAGSMLIGGWIIGVSFHGLKLAVGLIQLNYYTRKYTRPLTDRERLALPLQKGEIPDSVKILVAKENIGPSCWQFHHPTILLPASLFSQDRLLVRHVLLHEISHISTHHPTQLFIQQIATTLLWFHPVVRWAGKRAELSREFFCDQRVVQLSGSVRDYLQTLLTIAESPRSRPQYGIGFGRNRGQLSHRTRRLLALAGNNIPIQSYGNRRRRILSLTFFCISCLIAQIWIPMNVLASPASHWSPWPQWSARILHDVGVPVRDFEQFDHRLRLHDLIEATSQS